MKTMKAGAQVLTMLMLGAFFFSSVVRAQESSTAKVQTRGAEPNLVTGEPTDSAQSLTQQISGVAVPRLVKFGTVVTDERQQPRTGVVGVTFAIYKEQHGGAPVWMETQNVQLDASGRFDALLGATKSEGLPTELFATGEARWLGFQVQLPGEIEQPRVLLVSVPYAMKAADAESLGGRPASAYALAATGGATAPNPAGTATQVTALGQTVTPLAGTANSIPMFVDNFGTLGNSVLIQNGGMIGLGTLPAMALDVNGGIRGTGLATGGRNVAADAINTNALFLNGSGAMGVIGADKLAIGPGVLYNTTSIYSSGTERFTIVGQPKAMTLAAPGFTALFSIHLVGTNTAGGRVLYVIRATDGGSQIATEEGVIQYLATANSITCTVQTTDKLHLGTVNSGCTPGFFNPGSQPGISIFDNVSFSSPAPIVVHEVFFRIENESGSDIRLEP
ncbi:MAG TPA: hypothetical protein VKE93_16860 [Candidatus Angelobacter sp.]|nr:hypothetical protein [Candidatus Angelobacter sp.]